MHVEMNVDSSTLWSSEMAIGWQCVPRVSIWMLRYVSLAVSAKLFRTDHCVEWWDSGIREKKSISVSNPSNFRIGEPCSHTWSTENFELSSKRLDINRPSTVFFFSAGHDWMTPSINNNFVKMSCKSRLSVFQIKSYLEPKWSNDVGCAAFRR